MGRLVTFGCSYTYGSGLPDIFVPGNQLYPGAHPSEFAWPQLLANKLGLKCLNLASAGSGNKEILYKIITSDFEADDLIIIMWSHFPRYDFFRATLDSVSGVREVRKDIHKRSWLKNTDVISQEWKNDNAMQNYLAIKFIQMFLDDKNLNHYSLFTLPDFVNYTPPFFLDKKKIIRLLQNNFVKDGCPDGMHFGVKSHENLANILYDTVNK